MVLLRIKSSPAAPEEARLPAEILLLVYIPCCLNLPLTLADSSRIIVMFSSHISVGFLDGLLPSDFPVEVL